MNINYKNLRLNKQTGRWISRQYVDKDWWNCGFLQVMEVNGNAEVIYLNGCGSADDLLEAEKWLEGSNEVGLFTL